MTASGANSTALKLNSRSRRGTKVQPQTRLRTVIVWLSAGSATANDGTISTTGWSHSSNPSSTSVVIIIVVIDLVVQPIIISVSGVTASSPPSSLTPNPVA